MKGPQVAGGAPAAAPVASDGLRRRRRRTLAVLFLVAAVALLVRFSYVARASAFYQDYVHDDHDVIGINVVTGHGFSYQAGKDIPTISRAPLFPMVLGATYWLAGGERDFTVWRSVEAAVDAASAVLLVLFVLTATRRRADRSAPVGEESGADNDSLALAGTAGMLYALQPLPAFWAAKLTPETWMTFFGLLAALAFAAWLLRPTPMRAASLGLALGLLTLTKSVGLGLPALAAVAGILLLRRAGVDSRRVLVGALLVVVVAYGTVAPWTARNWAVAHAFVPVQTLTWYNFWIDMTAEGARRPDYNPLKSLDPPFPTRLLTVDQELRREATLKDEAFRYVRENPGDMVVKVADNLAQFWYEWRSPAMASVRTLAYLGQLVMALLGAVIALRTKRLRLLGGICVAAPAYLVVLYSPFHAHFRFSLPTVPFTAALAAVAICAIVGRARSRGRWRSEPDPHNAAS